MQQQTTPRSPYPQTEEIGLAEAERALREGMERDPGSVRALAMIMRRACLAIVGDIEREYALDSPRHRRRNKAV